MSALDIILGVILIIGMSSGYREGFLKSLFSLLAIFIGILAGFKLMGAAMLTLNQHYDIDEKVLPYAAFGAVFLVVVILVNFLGSLLRKGLEKTLLGSADSFAGALLGLFKTAFMISVLCWILDASGVVFFDRWTEHSWMYQHIAVIAPTVTDWAGELVPAVRDLFE
ncbi:MAG: CvpA family protein [Cyclobacteriaceae bacterium]|jgi:membrane protein required for colicin V production|nr:CvpA family protein [Cyclobacteriaceae bacterium]